MRKATEACFGEGLPFEALLRAKAGFDWRTQGSNDAMHYVYLLRSIPFPEQTYKGFTHDLKQRLNDHNTGQSVHTAKYMPWELVSYHAFTDKRKAQEFEHYLKTGSGKAFAKKRFW